MRRYIFKMYLLKLIYIWQKFGNGFFIWINNRFVFSFPNITHRQRLNLKCCERGTYNDMFMLH